MAEYEIQRERIVERPVVDSARTIGASTERIVEVPTGRRTVVERRDGAGYGFGFNPVAGILMALVAVLVLLLILGVLV